MMGDREGTRRQLTAGFVGRLIGQDMGGCPHEWRTEVTQLGMVPDWLKGRRSGHHMPSYGGVSVELRPHKQRETVPISLVELGFLRFDGHPPSGAQPRKGCSKWRLWNGRSPVLVGRSPRSSRLRSSSAVSAAIAASAKWPGTSTSVRRQCGRG